MPPPSSTASSTGGTKTKKKKTKSGTKKKKGLVLGGGSGGGGIKIKPFARPPSLPVNFYETSVGTLLRALGCVLREEPLYVDDAAVADGTSGGQGRQPCASPKSAADPAAAGSPVGPAGDAASATPMDLDLDDTVAATAAPGKQQHARRPMSREELYRLVEDLVTHKYGPQLYDAVLEAMDEAALTCLRRMVNVAPGCVEVDASAGGGGGSGNNKAVLFVPDGAAASAADSSGIAGADGNATTSDAILAQIHAVCASYYEYLRCVRSVFLHLDRRFVFLPGGGGDWKR